MKFFILAALLALAAAAPSYKPEDPEITIVSQSDERDGEKGTAKWSAAGSDGTTREEETAQKKIGYEQGNTNRGTSYHISPEGERITLTWVADENGFQPKGDHLPTPPPIPEEILKILPLLPKLEEVEPSYKPKPAYKS